MPQFTLRWANRGTSTQDWNINGLDQFQLQPDFVRSAQMTLDASYTFQIAVDTVGEPTRFAAATLTYTAQTGAWTLNSSTPAEWQLAAGGGIVTLRCLLSNNVQVPAGAAYSASDPVPDQS